MSKQVKAIDLSKLATNFTKEKCKEDLYWQRNDAKFRAVHQRGTTYDEFRQIVQAAHLRPLDRNETLALERSPIAWNQPAANSSSSSPILIPSTSIIKYQVTFPIPKNTTEFIQQWRRLSSEMKLDYLHQVNNLGNLFQTDIPTDLLHDLSLLYQLNSSYDNAQIIVNVLLNLTKSKRFELIKSFLTNKDKFELDLLFSRLCSFVTLRFSMFLLREVYL